MTHRDNSVISLLFYTQPQRVFQTIVFFYETSIYPWLHFKKYFMAWMMWICVMYCYHMIKRKSFHCSLASACVLSVLLNLGFGRMYPIVLHRKNNHISLLLSRVFDRLITAAITTPRITIIWVTKTTADSWQILYMASLFQSKTKAQL